MRTSREMGSLADVCAICDAPLAFGGVDPAVGLRAAIVRVPIRNVWKAESAGGATCLAARADVLDLLVATTRLAACGRGARRTSCSRPFAAWQSISGSETFSVAWNQSVDRTQALRPRRHERRGGGRGEDPGPLPVLREDPRDGAERRPVGRRLRGRRGRLLKVDKQAPAALRWIMTSNKAHLVALPPNMRLLERIAPEATCRQFIML